MDRTIVGLMTPLACFLSLCAFHSLHSWNQSESLLLGSNKCCETLSVKNCKNPPTLLQCSSVDLVALHRLNMKTDMWCDRVTSIILVILTCLVSCPFFFKYLYSVSLFFCLSSVYLLFWLLSRVFISLFVFCLLSWVCVLIFIVLFVIMNVYCPECWFTLMFILFNIYYPVCFSCCFYSPICLLSCLFILLNISCPVYCVQPCS